MTHGSLFSGIGGFDLAAEWAGIPTLWQVEKDPFCRAVLAKHFPNAKRYEDINDVGSKELAPVSIITGGFPCQPFSVAGKQRGKADDRYLWPEMLRIIAEVRPTWVIAENVAGIIGMVQYDSDPPMDSEGNGLGEIGDAYSRTGRFVGTEILESLSEIGYECWPLVIPACGVDARHRRNRVWIVGYSEHNGSHGESSRSSGKVRSESGQNETWQSERTGDVADSDRRRRKQCDENIGTIPEFDANYWAVEPDVGRVAHGISRRVDRLKALGNAIVPQVAYQIFKAIKEVDGE